MTFPDFSEYLKLPGKLETEESNWVNNSYLHLRQAKAVNDAMKKYKLKSIIEIGCSTGNLFQYLENKDQYIGFDANKSAIDLAKAKFVQHNIRFHNIDIRELPQSNCDLVCCFAFLKHFGLHEWDAVFQRCASLGKYFIFDMQIAEETKDDGIDFHHVWKSVDGLNKSIYDAALTMIDRIDGDPVAPIFICKRKTQ